MKPKLSHETSTRDRQYLSVKSAEERIAAVPAWIISRPRRFYRTQGRTFEMLGPPQYRFEGARSAPQRDGDDRLISQGRLLERSREHRVVIISLPMSAQATGQVYGSVGRIVAVRRYWQELLPRLRSSCSGLPPCPLPPFKLIFHSASIAYLGADFICSWYSVWELPGSWTALK